MQIKNKLKRYFQHRFLQQVEQLPIEEQEAILKELNIFPWEKLLKEKEISTFNFQSITLQEKAPKSGKNHFGVLILAGGDGSRLNHKEPKALFEILGKTLLERVLEKIDENRETFVLCSTKNIHAIEAFLKTHNLLRKKLHLLCQDDMPLLDLNQQFFLTENGLAKGPCGNADALIKMQPFSHQFEHLIVLPIDNPLADPQDVDFLSHHLFHQNEVTIKAIKSEAEANMGLLVQNDNHLEVVEYSDPYFEQALQSSSFYNTGIYCLQSTFLQRLRPTSFHLVKKQNTYKPEGFIFDHFAKANKIGLQIDEKSRCFCPLKEPKDIDAILAHLYHV
ncbi:MAG: putative uridylyltransferase [Chlamydiae bacterium]|nr:putative uridylyltransferase [Chlamydiota bacterium]